jgi:predicted phage terminase large subunit-like protein
VSLVHWLDVPIDAPDFAWCRYWDLAATEPEKKNPDPDWTAGALLAYAAKEWWLIDVKRIRATPLKTDRFMLRVAVADDLRIPDRPVPIRAEQEGGASGKRTMSELRLNVFVGRDFAGRTVTDNKIARARPMSTIAEAGHFHIVEGPWNEDWLDEMELFPDGTHDDQVDATSGAFAHLAKKGTAKIEAEAVEQENEWGAL